jgi:hypothetical protein
MAYDVERTVSSMQATTRVREPVGARLITGGEPMDTSTVITYDGPYLHVLLRDVLPPDWDEVRRELESEIECGARKVTIAIARSCDVSPWDPDLLELRDRLQAIGVPTAILA